MKEEITKEDISVMYSKQLRGVELSIVSSKIHIFANLIQTGLLLILALHFIK